MQRQILFAYVQYVENIFEEFAMAYGVFMHKHDSIYDDIPSKQYQFPKQYKSRADKFVNDWIAYLEPSRMRDTRGYFAIAKVQRIIPEPNQPDFYLALIEPGSYLDFGKYVQFKEDGHYLERGLLNEKGKLSGRAQAAIRPMSSEDFERIISRGLEADILPPENPDMPAGFAEDPAPFYDDPSREMITSWTTRAARDRNFRKIVLTAYKETCAITGIRLINGGGRAEAQAAHIKPVEHDGPDIVSNGIALTGTAHWMFDRGLISLSDNLDILISRQANDYDTIKSMINSSGQLIKPDRIVHYPHPEFIAWHRDNCYKH